MKILVVSDTHGDVRALLDAVSRESGCAMIIHLGDGERDTGPLAYLPNPKPLIQVRGNCDFYSDLPESVVTNEGGKTIYCTHGHTQMVKYGPAMLRQTASEKHADIALYGHTHVPVQTYEDGMYLCNPGSLRQGDYAVLEIVPSGIMWLPKRIY